MSETVAYFRRGIALSECNEPSIDRLFSATRYLLAALDRGELASAIDQMLHEINSSNNTKKEEISIHDQ